VVRAGAITAELKSVAAVAARVSDIVSWWVNPVGELGFPLP